MKKYFFPLGFLLCGFNSVFAAQTITVAATKYPNGQILENAVRPLLAKQGYDLKILYYPSYNDEQIYFHPQRHIDLQAVRLNPNFQVIDGVADANFFQHQAYLDEFNKTYSTDLISVEPVFYVPYGIYSIEHNKLKVVDGKEVNLKRNNSTVLISDYFINEERSLKFLQDLHLIMLSQTGRHSYLSDIESNPYQLNIYKVDSSVLPKMLHLSQSNMVVMNSEQAALQGISYNSALVIESKNSQYINMLVTTKRKAKSPEIKALAKALCSEDVKNFIKKNYRGEVVFACQ